METAETKDLKKIKKLARLGIISFMAIHLIFEIYFGFANNIALPLLFNFFVSFFIINRRISNGKHYKNPFIAGFLVSLFVFSIRLVLGIVIFNCLAIS